MQLKDKFMSRDFWKYFFAAVGTISSVVTLISFVFELRNPGGLVIVLYIVGVLGLSILFAVWQTWRKRSLSIDVSNNLTVKVAEGDLFSFAKDGNYVVIPVNEYFDTLVDDKVIHQNTLHGQFINRYYHYNRNELHEQIESFFSANGIIGEQDVNRKSEGYKVKYPLGTSAIIEKDNTHFVLLALTHFDEQDHAYVELSEFGRSISMMYNFISNKVGGKPVYMPLMGMGMSRLNQTAQFILKYTLDTIMGMKDLAIPGVIHIIVYPPTAKILNLNEIKY